MTDAALRPLMRTRQDSAHSRAVQGEVHDIVRELQGALGQALLSVIVDKDARSVARWVAGTTSPSHASEQVLRDTFQVYELIASADAPSVARAWFMGMNPQLDDASPAEALAEGRARDVIAAARAFINAGG
jgi:hypothetical protein